MGEVAPRAAVAALPEQDRERAARSRWRLLPQADEHGPGDPPALRVASGVVGPFGRGRALWRPGNSVVCQEELDVDGAFLAEDGVLVLAVDGVGEPRMSSTS